MTNKTLDFFKKEVKEIDREEQLYRRAEWIENMGFKEGDVMEEKNGKEYVYVETEHGTVGEDDHHFDLDKVYIPEELQTLNYPF